jgi:hypothetical protein
LIEFARRCVVRLNENESGAAVIATIDPVTGEKIWLDVQTGERTPRS